jgi:hypothetical protein
MALTDCPHCGAENFTMEGWEDLDHCSSCGEPLARSSAAGSRSRSTRPFPLSRGAGRVSEATGATRRDPAPPERDGASGTSPGSSLAYGWAMKFQVLEVANVDDGVPFPYWLTFQIRFAVDGSGVAAA